ncbi:MULTISPECIES: ABC transporter ATP-binding protein [unclassified Burkholderia]|uniref:ABC transporter ATP-binding protein n=1 Tax=unclassified Burkholderia TaxID=2613784 RepID=UPI000F571C9B|nr:MULTISPECIES: ATP-binding cassette domain-containing protein [unclassified Burkholderia]RQR40719.1 ATP-binding cassette domain-containing protein [Burkholderia sp. Bp9142]RQR45387.1 ATP-binding cassette domain-containing protein [Burkholderia sp. Bp9140]
MLILKDVTAGYDDAPVLHGTNLAMGDGEIVGVVGYNGMGKTSLLRAVMGTLPVRSGTITWRGAPIHGVPVHLRSQAGISLVAQGCTGFPKLTVMENLRLASFADRGRREHAIEKVLARIPRLNRLLKRPGAALSGGERQLLSLARALITVPRLLLIDEITDGVQPSVCDELSDLLNRIAQEDQLSMLIVDQDLSFVASVVKRAVVMQKGRIVADRSRVQLLGDTPFDVEPAAVA